MTVLRVATASWPIEYHDNWDAFADKAERWVQRAAQGDAALLVLPEYGAMELTSLLPEAEGTDLLRCLAGLQPLFPKVQALWSDLARRHGLAILSPSLPVQRGELFHNEAWLYGANGAKGVQAKHHMTRFEAEEWDIASADALSLFEIGGIKAGIAICYDSEFPGYVRRLVRAGAELILVPSCTEGMTGYTRVQVSARARAIENQCFAIHAPTVGSAPWSPAVDANTGAAGIYAPADRGFPETGILAMGTLNAPDMIFADLNFAQLRTVRTDGQVLNHRDWLREEDDADISLPVLQL